MSPHLIEFDRDPLLNKKLLRIPFLKVWHTLHPLLGCDICLYWYNGFIRHYRNWYNGSRNDEIYYIQNIFGCVLDIHRMNAHNYTSKICILYEF